MEDQMEMGKMDVAECTERDATQTEPVARRDIAALFGVLAGLVGAGCTNATWEDGDVQSERVATSVQSLLGTALGWVDTVLGDLTSKSSANISGAIVVIAK